MSPYRHYVNHAIRKAKHTYHLWRPDDGEPILGLHPRKRNLYIVLRRVHYQNSFGAVEIQKGFTTDLASIPAVFWFLPYLNPTDPKLRAGILHDWMYREQSVPRELADMIFRTCLIADGVKPWMAYVMYAAVRLFGGAAWRQHAAEKQAAEREHGEPD